MDIDKLNETLDIAEGLNKYNLTIITGRDRDSVGDINKETFTAENDLKALLYVFTNYNLQNAGMFNGDYDDEDLDAEDKALKEQILNCVKENKIQEGIKLLTDLYFVAFDPSDYYDNIKTLEGPNGIVFEDEDLDITAWDED